MKKEKNWIVKLYSNPMIPFPSFFPANHQQNRVPIPQAYWLGLADPKFPVNPISAVRKRGVRNMHLEYRYFPLAFEGTRLPVLYP